MTKRDSRGRHALRIAISPALRYTFLANATENVRVQVRSLEYFFRWVAAHQPPRLCRLPTLLASFPLGDNIPIVQARFPSSLVCPALKNHVPFSSNTSAIQEMIIKLNEDREIHRRRSSGFHGYGSRRCNSGVWRAFPDIS